MYRTTIISCFLLAVVIAGGCSKSTDPPPPPKPVEYYVYIVDPFTKSIYKLDATTDSIVDSAYISLIAADIKITPEGDQLWLSGRVIDEERMQLVVFDTITLTEIHRSDMPWLLLHFPENRSFAVGTRHDGTWFLDRSDFSVQDVDSVNRFAFPRLWPKKDTLVGYIRTSHSPHKTAFYDYDTKRIIDSFFVEKPDGQYVQTAALYFHPDGKRVFCIGGYSQQAFWICYDIVDRELLHLEPFYTVQSGFAFIRDGSSVYFSDPGSCFGHPSSFNLYKVDPYTFQLQDKLYMLRPDPEHGLWYTAQALLIHPDESKMYVCCGTECFLGPFLVIDLETFTITEVLFEENEHQPYAMVIGRK